MSHFQITKVAFSLQSIFCTVDMLAYCIELKIYILPEVGKLFFRRAIAVRKKNLLLLRKERKKVRVPNCDPFLPYLPHTVPVFTFYASLLSEAESDSSEELKTPSTWKHSSPSSLVPPWLVANIPSSSFLWLWWLACSPPLPGCT